MGRRGRCPYCGGELEFPDELERGRCMYCGRAIHVDELVTGNLDELRAQADVSYREALEEIPGIFLRYPTLMKKFNEFDYEEAFESFMAAERGVIEKVDLACRMLPEEERAERLQAIAERLVDTIMQEIQNRTKGSFGKKAVVVNDCKMQQVVFIVPMVRELHLSVSEEFADQIVAAWAARNKGDTYYKGDYHKMIRGFRNRKACYITTAVCETFDKPDNCYELMRFREFRDDYLLKQPECPALVDEYYELAPRIVAAIDMCPDSAQIYEGIWEEYLSPCLQMIEAEDYEGCEGTYVTMVRTLEQKYD